MEKMKIGDVVVLHTYHGSYSHYSAPEKIVGKTKRCFRTDKGNLFYKDNHELFGWDIPYCGKEFVLLTDELKEKIEKRKRS